jgi:hypothetical protein
MRSMYNDLAYALQPSLWTKEVLGIHPDPWQAEVLDGSAKRTLLCCSRQSGKSSVSSILSLHTALFRPGSLTLMVSPSLRQSSELFRKFLSYMEILEPRPAREEDTKLSLRLDNGSRVVSLPGSEGTIRGYSSVTLMVIDEAARVEDDLYFAVKPMLAVSNGRMMALSTPFGKRGWFFKEWEDGLSWARHRITALECPRISKEFLDEERRSMPRAWFNAEYMCEFTEATDAVFTYDQIQASISDEVEPLEF